MTYKNISVRELKDRLFRAEQELEEMKKNISWQVFCKLTEELEEERKLRLSNQNLNILLHKELHRYKVLVGDEKSTDEVAQN